ncbi:uncharacterized protein LOC135350906 [Halichondria panicea]|uniref:uncharacterized protein LOC135350906 n=1 Tax=Halichondria panicea TaxID=6063 RepID=UPI00312B5339
MRGYFSYIIVLAVITTLQSAKAVTFNARNLRLKQSPPGPTLMIKPGRKTKMTLQVSSNEPQFEVFRLAVRLGSTQIQRNKKNRNITVIYNSCTDSDDPQWSCKEVRITLRQRIKELGFQQMSFDLYNTTESLHNLTVIGLFSARESPTRLSTTIMATPSEDTTSTTSEQPGSTESLRFLGPVTALSLVIVVLVVLVLVLLCVCYQNSRTIKSLKQGES